MQGARPRTVGVRLRPPRDRCVAAVGAGITRFRPRVRERLDVSGMCGEIGTDGPEPEDALRPLHSGDAAAVRREGHECLAAARPQLRNHRCGRRRSSAVRKAAQCRRRDIMAIQRLTRTSPHSTPRTGASTVAKAGRSADVRQRLSCLVFQGASLINVRGRPGSSGALERPRGHGMRQCRMRSEAPAFFIGACSLWTWSLVS